MVTLCGFVIIGLVVLRFYRSVKHCDASLYPRFGLDIFDSCIRLRWRELARKVKKVDNFRVWNLGSLDVDSKSGSERLNALALIQNGSNTVLASKKWFFITNKH